MGWTEEDLRLRALVQQRVAALLPATATTKSAGKSKYNARKKEVDGHTFDSTAEARRYVALKEQQRIGSISALELQPRFLLQAGFRGEDGKWVRKIEYVADFRYKMDGVIHILDVKGYQTELFKVKWKLAMAKFPQYRWELCK